MGLRMKKQNTKSNSTSSNPPYPREITTTSCSSSEARGDDTSSSNNTTGTKNSVTPPFVTGPYQERWSEENIQTALRVWNLQNNPAMQRELRDLGHRLQDIHHFKNTPHELIRYLQGPQGMARAEPLFRSMIAWRLQDKIDDLLTTYKPPPTLYQYSASSMLQGLDHDGDPIYVERPGVLDGAGLVARYSRDTLLQHIVWLRELVAHGSWIEDYQAQTGHLPRTMTIIFDLQGLNRSTHLKSDCMAFFKELVSYTQEKYYAPSKRIIIIRAPALFRWIWSMAKPLFSQKVRDKMIFVTGGKEDSYLQVLQDYMDLNVLPPCIYDQGQGTTVRGMPPFLQGGTIPPDATDDDMSVLDTMAMYDTAPPRRTTSSSQWTAASSSFDSYDEELEDEGSADLDQSSVTTSSATSVTCRSLLKGSILHEEDGGATATLGHTIHVTSTWKDTPSSRQ
jgi:hypothetical protein